MTKNNIQIATDGSYQPNTMLGAGAAVMSQELDPEDTYICVGTKCSAVEGMTSLTAEQTGIISALLLMHIMCLRYGVPTVQCNITIWIDNEEALRRITTTSADDIRLKAYGVRDYGDLVLMRNLLHFLPTQLILTFKKVKSHQDTQGHNMTYAEQLNTLADEKANFFNMKVQGPIHKYTPTHNDGLILLNDNGIPIHEIEQHIRVKVNGEKTVTYLKKNINGTTKTYK